MLAQANVLRLVLSETAPMMTMKHTTVFPVLNMAEKLEVTYPVTVYHILYVC